MFGKLIIIGLVVLVASVIAPSTAIGGEALTVTRTDDPDPTPGCQVNDCSIREAIMAANSTDGTQTISIPAGDYSIQIPGAAEQANATGDFDITDSVIITGAGSANTQINAQQIERVFDIPEQGKTVSISGLTIKNGATATGGDGGGIRTLSDLTLDDVTVNDSDAGNNFGGGLVVEGGASVAVSNSRFGGNTAFSGGGISTFGGTHIEIANTFFESNAAGNGGGVSLTGTAEITDSTFQENGADFGGGAILSYGGNGDPAGVTMERVAVIDNMASNRGGGMDLSGVNVISESAIAGNSATVQGGGINDAGKLTLTNSTIGNNSTAGSGGGIFDNSTQGTSTFTSVTISSNTADSDGDHMGVGGGIFLNSGSNLTLRNSIVAGNTGGDCSGHLSSSDYNLIGQTTTDCPFSAKPHDATNLDAGLAPFVTGSDYHISFPLLPASAALDTGACPPDADQVSTTRPQGAACDKGAIEQLPGLLWGDSDCDGAVEPADGLKPMKFDAGLVAVSTADESCPNFNTPFGGHTWGDFDCSGEITAGDTIAILYYFAHLPPKPVVNCIGIGTLVPSG